MFVFETQKDFNFCLANHHFYDYLSRDYDLLASFQLLNMTLLGVLIQDNKRH